MDSLFDLQQIKNSEKMKDIVTNTSQCHQRHHYVYIFIIIINISIIIIIIVAIIPLALSHRISSQSAELIARPHVFLAEIRLALFFIRRFAISPKKKQTPLHKTKIENSVFCAAF